MPAPSAAGDARAHAEAQASNLAVVFVAAVGVFLQAALAEADWGAARVLSLGLSGGTVCACTPKLLVALDVHELAGLPADASGALSGRVRAALAVAWTLGAFALTLEEPFASIGNGYLAMWTAAVGACWMALAGSSRLAELQGRLGAKGLAMAAALGCASVIVLVPTTYYCGTGDERCGRKDSLFAATGVVSLAASYALLKHPGDLESLRAQLKMVSGVLLACWMVCIMQGEFDRDDGSFLTNGFVGCWVAIAASAALVDHAWRLSSMQAEASEHTQEEERSELLAHINVILLASLMILVFAGYEGVDNVWPYHGAAISVSTVALLRRRVLRLEGAATEPVGACLLAFWAAFAAYLTCWDPFQQLGNGYVAAWVALLASGSLAQRQGGFLARMSGAVSFEVAAVCLSSLVLHAQGLVDCTTGKCNDEQHVSLATCSLSLGLVLLIKAEFPKEHERFPLLLLVLFACWSVGVFILMYQMDTADFTQNAYAAPWCAWAASTRAIWLHRSQIRHLCSRLAESLPEGPGEPGAAVVGVAAAQRAEYDKVATSEGGNEGSTSLQPSSFV